MLRVEGAVEGMPQGALAVNEAAVQRSGAGMISVECRVDDQQVATYYGDGVIVSTPTGSDGLLAQRRRGRSWRRDAAVW